MDCAKVVRVVPQQKQNDGSSSSDEDEYLNDIPDDGPNSSKNIIIQGKNSVNNDEPHFSIEEIV